MYKRRCEVQFEQDKALRLKRLYLEDKTSTNNSEFKKDYPIHQFENDKDPVKMSVLYFIEFVMIGRKRRQHMD